MINAAEIADRYIALWNEKDAGVRQSLLAKHWAGDATYIDPMMAGTGIKEIDTLIGGVHTRFPDFSFRLIRKADGYGDQVRFSWGLGPEDDDSPIEGTDFIVIKDGRIQSVAGFLDRVPAM